MPDLIPFALKDAPALIEAVFPAQKVSFEAQSERKAVAAQTLTGLGSYWKGRKPLILVRAIVLGSLLPQTGDAEKDLEIFEKLMGFDDEGLARRALSEASMKASEIAMRISISNPWDFFKHSIEGTDPAFRRVAELEFPLDREMTGFSVQWRRDVTDDDKLTVYRRLIATFGTYEDKAAFCCY